MSAEASLPRRAAAEALRTAALVAVVVGSGIQAAGLTDDVGVRLLANSLATVLGMGVLVALLGPVSGAHLNPVVTLAAWCVGRRSGDGPTGRDLAAYLPAQTVGAAARCSRTPGWRRTSARWWRPPDWSGSSSA